MRNTLTQILRQRLGDVPSAINKALQHCTLDQLNTLVNPALDASTWEVFAEALPGWTE